MNVGVIGHQDLGSEEATRWVSDALVGVVDRRIVTTGLTCLAAGADQLYAEILVARGVPFVAVIACAQIEASFAREDARIAFRRLLAMAASTVQMPFDAPGEEAYLAAGKLVVDRSDLLVAVWDGKPARGLGGTGDVVRYARERGKGIVHVDSALRRITDL